MGKKEVWIGNNQVVDKQPEPKGEFVEIDRELYYRISDFNYMPDFYQHSERQRPLDVSFEQWLIIMRPKKQE